jgi:type IV secretory pathway VirB6-like protein
MNSLFSVLPKENCLLFYIISVFSLIIFAVTLVVGLMSTKTKWKVVVLSSLGPLFMYYFYRLLYSMCEGSLQ